MCDLAQSNFHARRTSGSVFIAVLFIVLARVAYAAEPLMNEQDINERSVISQIETP
jgi:hypothetical protein